MEEVRHEIAVNRAVYIRESERAYTARMAAAAAGRDSFPRVRNFNKGNALTSTNSVFEDLEAAHDMNAVKTGNEAFSRGFSVEISLGGVQGGKSWCHMFFFLF